MAIWPVEEERKISVSNLCELFLQPLGSSGCGCGHEQAAKETG